MKKHFLSNLAFLLFSLSLFAQNGSFGFAFNADATGGSNYFMIMGIAENSPAEKAGIKVGERLAKIDGKEVDISSMTMEDAMNILRGPVGGSLTLTFTDVNDINKKREIKLVRADTGEKPKINYLPYIPQEFATRLYDCLKALKNKDPELKAKPDGEKLWKVSHVYMNDAQKGIYSESNLFGESGNIEYKMFEYLESRDWAAFYYKKIIEKLKEELATESEFEFSEEKEEKGNDASGNRWTNLDAFFFSKDPVNEWDVSVRLYGDSNNWSMTISIGYTYHKY